MKRKGFTLIELIAVLVIIAIIALSATVIVKNVVEQTRKNARKRNIDMYGRAIELAASEYLLDTGSKADDINLLNIKYSGSDVSCDVKVVYQNNVFLSKCSVDGVLVKDMDSMDGYYQYGNILKFGDLYFNAAENAIKRYKIQHNNQLPNSINELEMNLNNLDFSCNVSRINPDSTVYFSECKLAGISILSNETKDGYYHHGEIKYKLYNIGDSVVYQGVNYYVIHNSSQYDSKVNLLKDEPLKYDEVRNILNNPELFLQIVSTTNGGYATVKYGQNSKYENSYIKSIVDTWALQNTINVELIEARLITLDELMGDLNFYKPLTTVQIVSSDNTPRWSYLVPNLSYSSYWTMTPFEDYDNLEYYVYGSSGSYGNPSSKIESTSVSSSNMIRPVIIIKKDTLDKESI